MQQIESVQQLNLLSYTCCYSTVFSQKSQAQSIVAAFSKKLMIKIQDLDTILGKNGSETTIFVLVSFFEKQIKEFSSEQAHKLVHILLFHLSQWYNPNKGTFTRAGKIVEGHIINSIFNLVAEAIKAIHLVENITDASLLVTFAFKNNMELLFWRYVVSAFASIDMDIGFAKYRTLCNMFQDHGIVLAIKSSIPYFTVLTQNVRINELSALHENMEITQKASDFSKSSNNSRYLQFTELEMFLTSSALKLIQAIFDYPYNITYGEYEMDTSFDHSIVWLPDSVSEVVKTTQFYSSLFFLTERLVIQFPNHALVPVCALTLGKLILTRLSFFNDEQKTRFTKTSLIGMTNLMKIPNHAVIFNDITTLNSKMLSNTYITKMAKFPMFAEWFELLQRHIQILLFSKPLNYENDETFEECFFMLSRLSNGFKYLVEDDAQKKRYYQMISRIFTRLILTLYQQKQYLSEGFKYQKKKKLKQTGSKFFGYVTQLLLYNFQELVSTVYDMQTQIFNKLKNNEIINVGSLINLNGIMAEIVTQNVINNIICQSSSSTTNCLLTLRNMLENHLKYINLHYQSIGAKYQNDLLNNSVIFLVENVMIDFCSNMCLVEQVEPHSKIQDIKQILISTFCPKKILQARTVDTEVRSESRLLKAASIPPQQHNEIFSNFMFLIVKNLESQDSKHVTYILEILNSLVVKIKWSMRRAAFKKLPVIKYIIQYCGTEALKNFQSEELMKCRTELTKLITLMVLDDSLDSYRENMERVLESSGTGNMVALMFDLKGMAEQIDAPKVFRYFLENTTPLVHNILNYVCSGYLNNQKMLKVLTKMCVKYIHNNAQRVNVGTSTVRSLYIFVKGCIPYWIAIIRHLQKQLEEQNQCLSPSKNMIECFNKLLQGRIINFSVLEGECESTDEYVVLNIRFIQMVIRSRLYLSPKMKTIVGTCLKFIIGQLCDYIYQIKRGDTYSIEIYSKLFAACLKILHLEFDILLSHVREIPQQIGTVLDFLLSGLEFQSRALIYQHNVLSHKASLFFRDYLRHNLLDTFVECANNYVFLNPVQNKVKMDKMAKIMGFVVKMYPGDAVQLVERVQKMIPNSSEFILKYYFESCMSQGPKHWAINLSNWREVMKPGDMHPLEEILMCNSI